MTSLLQNRLFYHRGDICTPESTSLQQNRLLDYRIDFFTAGSKSACTSTYESTYASTYTPTCTSRHVLKTQGFQKTCWTKWTKALDKARQTCGHSGRNGYACLQLNAHRPGKLELVQNRLLYDRLKI